MKNKMIELIISITKQSLRCHSSLSQCVSTFQIVCKVPKMSEIEISSKWNICCLNLQLCIFPGAILICLLKSSAEIKVQFGKLIYFEWMWYHKAAIENAKLELNCCKNFAAWIVCGYFIRIGSNTSVLVRSKYFLLCVNV